MVGGFPSTSGDDYQLNITSIIKYASATYPEVEVASRREDGSIFRYSYREAYERTCRLANALKKFGVKPGDRVGVMEWNTYRHFELYFAIAGIGAVALQLNLRLAPADVAYVVNHSGARFIAVGDSLLPVMESVADKLNTVEGFILLTDKELNEVKTTLSPISSYEALLGEEEPNHDWPMIDEKSAYSACYTSGTTGRPKGVYYSHRCIYLHTMAFAMTLGVSASDVVLQLVPMFHAQGWGMWLMAPMVGAKLVFSGRYTAEATNVLVDLMVSEKATVSAGAPALFMPMLDCIRKLPEKPDLRGLRMISGATEPPLAMMKGYWDLGGAEIIHAYGATETTPIVLMNRFKPSIKGWTKEREWENQKKQGLPLAGLDFRIASPDGAEVPHDGETVGEVLIRGPWITSSYYDDERTETCFKDGYWMSGDVATVDGNGYVKITDRIKDVIKSGGEWISSIDLENAIMAHPGVAEAAVVGLTHPKWQERPLAVVVLREDARGSATKEDILKSISGKFARWQLPDDVLFVEVLPKTSVGKFSKKTLREQYKDYYMAR
jgi:fatty-acyl-CoA synthase